MADPLAGPPLWLERVDRPGLAWRHGPAAPGCDLPVAVFLPGYMSDMAGGKAAAVAADCAARGQGWVLLDYSGCGLSDGEFAAQRMTDWRDDVLAVIAAAAPRAPVLLIGSSLGGWLMLLVALALVAADGPGRVAGLIGIAAAPDFTEWGFSDAEKAVIAADGVLTAPSPYGEQPYLTSRIFWESGQANRLLDRPIALNCPVDLLHGQCDDDVPWALSLRLAAALTSTDVRVTLVKDGDHRLSRPGDVDRLLAVLRGQTRSG